MFAYNSCPPDPLWSASAGRFRSTPSGCADGYSNAVFRLLANSTYRVKT
ncbi:MAG: hypothetical protein M3228_09930 [Actinomycetota bacterium]|nr:hypothetical protein [Actinomycetota bacterium]